MKIGILTCIHSNDVCTRAGCLNAFYHRTDYFQDYPAETELVVMMTCNGCKEERSEEPEQDAGILEKLERVSKEGVSKIHVGVCRLLEDKTECERITKICALLEKQGVEVIRGTHRE